VNEKGQERQARRSSSAARLNRIGRRKGVLEGFVERLFLAPMLIAIAIALMEFVFRIGNHFGFSDGADKDLRGYDANFGALIVERYPFRFVRLPQNILMTTRPSAVFPPLEGVGS
jgi:hypothetical protein